MNSGRMTSVAAPWRCVLVFFALAFASRAAAQASEATVLAESDFLWDVDGWTTRGPAENFQHGQKMIKASDKGPDVWHFVAPEKFLGAKRAAYGGKLSFRHGFFEYNRCFVLLLRVQRSSAPGHCLGLCHLRLSSLKQMLTPMLASPQRGGGVSGQGVRRTAAFGEAWSCAGSETPGTRMGISQRP